MDIGSPYRNLWIMLLEFAFSISFWAVLFLTRSDCWTMQIQHIQTRQQKAKSKSMLYCGVLLRMEFESIDHSRRHDIWIIDLSRAVCIHFSTMTGHWSADCGICCWSIHHLQAFYDFSMSCLHSHTCESFTMLHSETPQQIWIIHLYAQDMDTGDIAQPWKDICPIALNSIKSSAALLPILYFIGECQT